MNNNYYYKGFEGEPEIQFIIRKEDEDYIFSIWEGYFDRIMSLLKPDKNGWTGIAYVYHMDIGWYDEEIWAVDNLRDTYDKFISIPKSRLDNKCQNVLLKICCLLNEALKKDYYVFIRRC